MKLRARLGLLAALALLAACGRDKTDAGDTAYRGPDGDQPLVLDAPAAPPALPAGITPYPGAKIILATEIAPEGGERSALVAMETADAPEAVTGWYAALARKAGYRLYPPLASGKVRAVGGKADDGRVFSVSASARAGGTSIQLIAGNAPGADPPAADPPVADPPAAAPSYPAPSNSASSNSASGPAAAPPLATAPARR